jgi:hypothetical protein
MEAEHGVAFFREVSTVVLHHSVETAAMLYVDGE